MSIEAMKLALEALENAKEVCIALQEYGIRAGKSAKEMRVGEVLIHDRAITALRQAIEQAEQAQPVACIGSLNEFRAMELVNKGFALTDPLYTAPPPRKPLTDEEIKRMAAKWFLSMYWPLCNTFAREIEAAHGITKENT